ncbi:MAG: ABC transporter ATP-binding protein [Acidobacteriota bacterium]|nr:ABC transporter ATP-binding protein [Acidobacteriota bacterium]
MTVIRTCELSKSFRRTHAVVKLNLEIPEGSIFALVGPNGAGKTTAIKMLMNILRPSAGTAEVLGTDSRRLGPAEFAQIGYVSENQELPLWMTVDYFMSYLKPFYPDWDNAWAEELLRQLDLPRGRRLRDLSRGMRIKAALASSLAYHPKLIVLDEPFSGLDSLVRDELIEALLERCAGATVMISSHDLAEIETFASHIGYLDGGCLRFSEEMTSLATRFREIEITFDESPALPAPWPPTWLGLTQSAAVLRFVDSQFHADSTPAAIRIAFPSARAVAINPMPLRAIFVSLAKSGRKAA